MKWWLWILSGLALNPAWSQSRMGVEFKWLIGHHCSAQSPLIKLKNIPPGTTALEVVMVDLDSQNPAHGGGGGLVMNEAGFPSAFDVPAGALSNYTGPCPDNFTTLGHEYEITVTALNADKQSLSKGSLKAPFSGKFVILQGVIGSP